MIIKVLLIAAALGIAIFILREKVPGQRQALRRGVGVLVVVAGIIAVLWPELTTSVANAVGVVRGTDLLLYTAVMVFAYQALATAQRIHRLEHEIRVLTRELALSQPLLPGTGGVTTRPMKESSASPAMSPEAS